MLAGILPAYGAGLGELMADYNRVVTAGPLVSSRTPAPAGSGTCPASGRRSSTSSPARRSRVVRGVELTAQALFTAGARRVLLPSEGAPVVRTPGELGRLLARPVPRRALQLFSVHLWAPPG